MIFHFKLLSFPKVKLANYGKLEGVLESVPDRGKSNVLFCSFSRAKQGLSFPSSFLLLKYEHLQIHCALRNKQGNLVMQKNVNFVPSQDKGRSKAA